MILLDLCYNSGENEVLIVKIGDRVLDLWLDKFHAKGYGHKLPVTSFQVPNPKCHSFKVLNYSHVKILKIVHKASTYFHNLMLQCHGLLTRLFCFLLSKTL